MIWQDAAKEKFTMYSHADQQVMKIIKIQDNMNLFNQALVSFIITTEFLCEQQFFHTGVTVLSEPT